MIIPVRCFTCGKLIAHYWHSYQEMLFAGYTEEEALDGLQFTRFCCRRMFLTHVDFCDPLLAYNPAMIVQAANNQQRQQQQQPQQQQQQQLAFGH